MINKPYKDYFDLYEENESEPEEFQSKYPLKKVVNLISRDKTKYFIERWNTNLMLEIFKDKNEVDDEEMKDKEQKLDDKVLYEIKNLENKDSAIKSTTKTKNENKNAIINPKFEIIHSFKETDIKILSKKRNKPSFSSPNRKSKENSLNKKEDFKTKKEKNQKKNDYSPSFYIIKFHNLLNIYFKCRVKYGKYFNTEYFKNEGPNAYYLNKNLTQKNIGAKNHPEKLKQKITDFIQKNNLEKLKKINDKEISEMFEFTVKQLIEEFRDYIFENSAYFKENETIKEINENLVRIRRYPLIDFEKKEFGYYKFFSCE
jgi:hypothetical protein